MQTENNNDNGRAGYVQALQKYAFKPAHLLNLDNFISPKVLLILYWLAMAFTILAAVIAAIGALLDNFVQGLGMIIIGVPTLALLLLFVRMFFESMVVFFNINNHLLSIRDNTAPRG